MNKLIILILTLGLAVSAAGNLRDRVLIRGTETPEPTETEAPIETETEFPTLDPPMLVTPDPWTIEVGPSGDAFKECRELGYDKDCYRDTRPQTFGD